MGACLIRIRSSVAAYLYVFCVQLDELVAVWTLVRVPESKHVHHLVSDFARLQARSKACAIWPRTIKGIKATASVVMRQSQR